MLWRESLHVLMTPDRLDYRVLPPVGLTPTDIGSIPCAPVRPKQPAWQPACEALTQFIDQRKGNSLRIEIQLSDRFVRYQVLEWRAGISSRAEWRSYARHVFSTVHGDAVKDWDYRIDLVPPGRPSLACAIDNALIETLHTLAGKHAARLVGVRPRFVNLFNRQHFAAQHKDPLWFAVVEDRHVCLGVQADKTWHAVRNEAAPDGWLAALPGMIRRVRAGIEKAEGGKLYLCGSLAGNSIPAVIDGLPVHATETGFLRGRAVAVKEG